MKYKLFIRGENLLVDYEGTKAKHGFYVTRVVEADGADEAAARGIHGVLEELKQVTLNKAGDEPMLGVEESGIWNDDEDGNDTGYSWYEE